MNPSKFVVRSEEEKRKGKERKRKANSLLIATFYLPKFWRERDRGRERDEEMEETPFNSAYKGSDREGRDHRSVCVYGCALDPSPRVGLKGSTCSHSVRLSLSLSRKGAEKNQPKKTREDRSNNRKDHGVFIFMIVYMRGEFIWGLVTYLLSLFQTSSLLSLFFSPTSIC